MALSSRDRSRLSGIYPPLQTALEGIFAEMEKMGHPMFVVQGVRTQREQQALFAQGRTTPGKIVTMKDGIRNKSDHQPDEDGWGHAVDCAFLGPKPFDDAHPWESFGETAEAYGLTWGGRWSHPHDSPHVEVRSDGARKA